MKAVHYRLHGDDLGPPSVGVTGSITTLAYAKGSYGDKPFVVPNEYICNKLASLLFLPVPVGMLIRHGESMYFASQEALGEDSRPALYPGQETSVIEEAGRDATGIVVFDCWVFNQDRTAHNVIHDPLEPTRIQMIDHGEALFVGRNSIDARARLERSMTTPGLENNILNGALARYDDVGLWIERIQELPHFQIQSACKDAVGTGYQSAFTEEDADWCTDFLLRRRRQLFDLIDREKPQTRMLFNATANGSFGVEDEL